MVIANMQNKKEIESFNSGVKVTKRGFFNWSFWGLVAFLNIVGIATVFSYILKTLLPSTWVIRPYIFRKIYASSLNEINITGSTVLLEDKENNYKAILINNNDQIQAFSLTCPHLGCQVRWKKEERKFICPCHNGIFRANGEVESGPPPKPLAQYPVDIEGNMVFIKFKEPFWQPDQYFKKII